MIFTEVNLNNLLPSTTNPRLDFGNIDGLSLSMEGNVGVIEPITVRPLPDGKFEVVVGSRRVRAARQANRKTIGAVVKELTNKDVVRMQLVENIQRKDLTPSEEGRLFKQMQETFGYSRTEIASQIGKEVTYVTLRIQLLDLPKDIVPIVTISRPSEDDAKVLSFGKARALIPLTEEKQKILATRITTKGMTQAEVITAIKKDKEVTSMIQNVKRTDLKERLEKKYLTLEASFDEKVSVKNVDREIKLELGIPIGPSLKKQWDEVLSDLESLQRKLDPEADHSWVRKWTIGDREYVQMTIWMDLGDTSVKADARGLLRVDYPLSKFVDFQEADQYAKDKGGYCSGVVELRGKKLWCIYEKRS